MENVPFPPGRRYLLHYRAHDLKDVKQLLPCATYRGQEACCEGANTWADPCLKHPIKIQCNGCAFLESTTISLRECYPAPDLSPREPVQHHLQVTCPICTTNCTIAVLRVVNEEVALEHNNRNITCMEIQVVGPFRVITTELFGSANLPLPTLHYLCQGHPGSNPNTLYQGKLLARSFVALRGYNVKFSRVRVDGRAIEVEGLDGYWREHVWRVDGYSETSIFMLRTNDFTVAVPGWPPTRQQINQYFQNPAASFLDELDGADPFI